MRNLLLILVAVIAGGCASSPPRYFTLDMTPSGTVEAPVNINVSRIRVADALAGKNILIKKSPTEIEYYALDQWVAELNDLLREKLQAEFGDAVEGRPAYDLAGDLLAFEQVDLPEGGVEAHARMALAFRPVGASRYADVLLERSYAVRLPSEATPAAIVQTLTACVEQIAAAIASDAAQLPAGNQ